MIDVLNDDTAQTKIFIQNAQIIVEHPSILNKIDSELLDEHS